MIDLVIKWVFKLVFNLVLWVLILSIRWEGQTLFKRAQNLLLESPVSGLVDENLQFTWDNINEIFNKTYAKIQKNAEEKKAIAR